MSRRTARNDPPLAASGPVVPARAQRVAALLACAALFILGLSVYAGVWGGDPQGGDRVQPAMWWVILVAGVANDGALLAGWVVSAAMLGAVALRPLREELRSAAPSLRILTFVGAGLGLIGLLALAWGLAGALNRATAALLLLLGPALWAGMLWREPEGVEALRAAWRSAGEHLRGRASWGWLYLLAMPALVVAAAAASMVPGFLWKPFDPHPFDAMAYHLQVPREWYEAGRIVPLGHNVYSFFPFGVEIHFLLAMHLRGGPWAGMYTAQFLSLTFAALSVAAAHATVADRQRRRGRSGGPGPAAAGALAASVPWMAMVGSVAYVEGALLFYLALALAWGLRAMEAEAAAGARNRAMILGGAMAGLACGVKYTGVPTVLLFVPAACAIGAIVAGGWQRLRGAIVGGILFVVAGSAAFAPWAIRNWAWTKNPVFPMAMGTLGSAHFDGAQVERWERAHRARPEESAVTTRLWLFADRVLLEGQFGYVLVPAGVLAAAGLLVGRSTAPAGAALLVLMALQVLFWLAFTHLMPRFALALVPLGAIAVGIACVELPRPARWSGPAVAAVATVAGFAFLHAAFWPRSTNGRIGFYRLDDMEHLNPPALRDLGPRGVPIALIGDMQAFFRQSPMELVKYRTVFDVRFKPGVSVIDAWLGVPEAQLRERHVVVVHTDELRRLATTYHGVPDLPDTPVPSGYGIPEGDDLRPVGPIPWSRTENKQHIYPQGVGGR